MELKGEYRIAAPRQQVWALLNDADVLRACIPGCETLEGTPAEGFAARVTTKIGPVKATFNGAVRLSNVNAPESYTISGEGKGGVAGFAKGGADVHLAEDGADTVLTYVVNAQVGGKLAQLGSRLIDSTAKKLADQFFTCFAERAGAPVGAGSTTEMEAIAVATALAQGEAASGMPPSDIILPGDIVLPGDAVPPTATGRDARTGVPITGKRDVAPAITPPANAGSYGLDATTMPDPELGRIEAKRVETAITEPATGGATIESIAHEVEAEVEREAAVGFLGGPIVWALLVILALLFVYVIAT